VAAAGGVVVGPDTEDRGDAVDFGASVIVAVEEGIVVEVPAVLVDGNLGVLVKVVGKLAQAVDDVGAG